MKLLPYPVLLLAASAAARCLSERATGPFFRKLDNASWVIGNEIWNMTQQVTFGVKLYYRDHDCVGNAMGHYVSYDSALNNLDWTDASVASSGTYNSTDWIDVVFTANEGYMHWVIFSGLPGAYQYFVNKALPDLGEFRTLWRLDNATFTHGHNDVRDEPLPPLSDYLPENKVQDETWLAPDGQGYITKYDFAAFVRAQTAYGVYGPGFGSWYINPGREDYNGNHLKQELTVHRESTTGDTVMLNMLHGTHFMASSNDTFAAGRTWGPWLWYLNDGSVGDAEARAQSEFAAWPYAWFDDEDYHSRGSVSGRLVLSDGRPASNAAVFLGDDNPTKTALDMGSSHYYTTHADDAGNFELTQVRAASYGLQAWPGGGGTGGGGGSLANVTTHFLRSGVEVAAGRAADLGTLGWAVSNRTQLFRVGDLDRFAYGFRHGGAPRAHGRADDCPADLTYATGRSGAGDWCFAQSRAGNWTIEFEVGAGAGAGAGAGGGGQGEATLIVSLAGYSTGTDAGVYVNGAAAVGSLAGGAGPGLLASDPSLYRSATAAGEWRHLEFPFDAGLLARGLNTVTFEVTRSTKWHGIMWDSIVLEW